MNDTKLLKRTIEDTGITISSLANKCGISRTTFYARMESGDFHISEVSKIKEALRLTNEEVAAIFFPEQRG